MAMDLPTPGLTYDDFDLEVLREMHECRCVRRYDKPSKLKSKVPSHVYVRMREDLTECPKLGGLIGQKICRLLNEHRRKEDRQHCLIGVPTAGTPLAAAGSLMSITPWGQHSIGAEVHYRIMREVKKEHGVHQTWIDGKPELDRHTYWWIDNVATTGQSKIDADAKGVEDGYPKNMPILIWVDRQQGAIKQLQQAGFGRIVVGYNLLDLTFAFSEMHYWPKSTVKAVEEEIADHQFV